MTEKNLYPYQPQYEFYLTTVKQYKERTLIDAEIVLSKFWKFYLTDETSTSEIKDVKESNIRSFFNYSEKVSKYKNSTLNKFLVHLKSYFAWLTDHNLIAKTPTLFVAGRPIPRKNTFVLNWNFYIADFIENEKLSLDTKKILLTISFGYLIDDLIDLQWADLKQQVNSKMKKASVIINFINENMIDHKFVFDSKKIGHVGEKLKTNRALRYALKKDAKNLPFEANLINIRQSYVYTLVNDKEQSDKALMQKLHCNQKTLTYYRDNLLLFNFVDYSSIKNKKSPLK